MLNTIRLIYEHKRESSGFTYFPSFITVEGSRNVRFYLPWRSFFSLYTSRLFFSGFFFLPSPFSFSSFLYYFEVHTDCSSNWSSVPAFILYCFAMFFISIWPRYCNVEKSLLSSTVDHELPIVSSFWHSLYVLTMSSVSSFMSVASPCRRDSLSSRNFGFPSYINIRVLVPVFTHSHSRRKCTRARTGTKRASTRADRGTSTRSNHVCGWNPSA